MTGLDSPRSRNWVAEEGEIFRKGTVLLGPEELEGEYAGEELRKEVRLSSLSSQPDLTQAVVLVARGHGRTSTTAPDP